MIESAESRAWQAAIRAARVANPPGEVFRLDIGLAPLAIVLSQEVYDMLRAAEGESLAQNEDRRAEDTRLRS